MRVRNPCVRARRRLLGWKVVLVVFTGLPASLMRVPVGCEWIKSTLAHP